MESKQIQQALLVIRGDLEDLQRLANAKIVTPGHYDYGGTRPLSEEEMLTCLRILIDALRHDFDILKESAVNSPDPYKQLLDNLTRVTQQTTRLLHPDQLPKT